MAGFSSLFFLPPQLWRFACSITWFPYVVKFFQPSMPFGWTACENEESVEISVLKDE